MHLTSVDPQSITHLTLPDISSHVHLFSEGSQFKFIAYPDAIISSVNNESINIEIDFHHYNDCHPQIRLEVDFNGNEITKLFSPDGDTDEYGNWEQKDTIYNHSENIPNQFVQLEVNEDDHPLMLDETYINYNDFPELEKYNGAEIFWNCSWDDFTISYWDDAYIVSDPQNKILSVLIAPETDLQSGDASTSVYLLNNKHILIWNGGDVMSIVLIKHD